MSKRKNDLDKVMTSLLKGQSPANGLEDQIMNRIADGIIKKKAKRVKEKIVMISYAGATILGLLLMLFLADGRNYAPKVNLPYLETPLFYQEDLSIYYRLIIIISVFSLIFFGIYYAKSKHIRQY